MNSASKQSEGQEEFAVLDLEAQMELWQNMQLAGTYWLEATKLMSETQNSGDIPLDPLGISTSLADSWLNFWRNPEHAIKKQAEYFDGFSKIWTHYFLDGNKDDPEFAKGNERRFKHPAWQENLVSAYLKSCYLFLKNWVAENVQELDSLDAHEKIVTEFSTRNLVEAMNPANFAISNPEVIEATIQERGANLVRGMQMLLEDVRRGNGQLLMRQVDYSAFEVGKNVAVTSGKVIYECPHFQLIQYAPSTKTVHETPIMICPPWINKYYILDLNEQKSFAKWLVDQGYTVFMVSWHNADKSSKGFTWDKRLSEVRKGIQVVLDETGSAKTHLISFCIGGTMIGSLLAWLNHENDDVVASSTFLTAQFDFEHAGELLAFVSEKSIGLLDGYDAQGFIPAENMSNAFNLLRANDLVWSYFVNNYMLGKTPMAFDLLYWNSDSMRMPTQIQKYYLREFYLKNAFMKNTLSVHGKKLGVGDITVPTYHLAAIDDHIAPAASVYFAAKAMVNADVRYVLAGSGHIAGVINPPYQNKYQYWRNDDLNAPDLSAWQKNAETHAGSWWNDWASWMERFDDKEVKARKPGRKHKPIEDAPGSYVRVRFDEGRLQQQNSAPIANEKSAKGK